MALRSSEPNDRIVAEFAARCWRQNVATVVAITCISVVFWVIRRQPQGGTIEGAQANLCLLCTPAGFAAVFFGFVNWRCPACNRHLGSNGVRGGRCYSCDAYLRPPTTFDRRWLLWSVGPWVIGAIVALCLVLSSR